MPRSFSDVVRARRMVRAYSPEPVDAAVLDSLIDLALRAPSAGNAQGVDLVVLTEREDRDRFWRASAASVDDPDPWLAGMLTAPVLVLLVADPGAYARRYSAPDKVARLGVADLGVWPVRWWDVDAGMSAQLLLLSAVEAGLGACLFGVAAGRHDAVHEAFAIPDGRRVVGVVSIGHPAPRPPQRPPRSRPAKRTDAVHDGRFGTVRRRGD